MTTTGEEAERDIPFLKGYTVFNVEQIEGLPAHYLRASAERGSIPCSASQQAEAFFAATGAHIRHGGNMAYYSVSAPTMSRCRRSSPSAMRKATTRRSRMR